jgi:tRNA-specific 2-thiouridylase
MANAELKPRIRNQECCRDRGAANTFHFGFGLFPPIIPAMPANRGKVVVAMSGGVDSSVAAALLQREGYEVIGVFLRLGSPDGVESHSEESAACSTGSGKSKQGCCSVLDAADARRVADLLGVPFYVLNFQKDFARIIDYFVDEYNRGRTPNPCVRCNDWLKFGRLADYARAVGAEYLASGHYARIGVDATTGGRALVRGRDQRKDQSYVLFGMNRETLDHTLLPIGDMEKQDVRAIAEEMKLPVYNKPDSQEICFVPDQDYAGLVRRRTPDAVRPGELVTSDGAVVGKHEGHQHFTIGQRKGVGVAFGRPIYVVDINPDSNRVTVADRESLQRSALIAKEVNWLSDRPRPVSEPMPCVAKIRYNQAAQAATVVVGEEGMTVRFAEPQAAITPGQAVVVYDGDILLGGGWIEKAID